MNFLDLLIAIPLGYLIYKGYRRGIIFEVASLTGVIGGSVIAVRLAHWFSEQVGLTGNNSLLISFFLLFVGVVLTSLFLGKLAERFVKLIHVGFLNNFAGALLGLAKGVCIIGVLLYFITFVDFQERLLKKETKEVSILYAPVEKAGSQLAGSLENYIIQRKNSL